MPSPYRLSSGDLAWRIAAAAGVSTSETFEHGSKAARLEPCATLGAELELRGADLVCLCLWLKPLSPRNRGRA